MSGNGEVSVGSKADQVDVPETILIRSVQISDLNPRSRYEGDVSSLVTSIGEGGNLIQAIVVRRRDDGRYEVIVGARRFKALRAIRGENGALRNGEFRIVKWTDDECIKAAVSENREREDLSPVCEGRYANALADRLESQKEKATDEVLSERTGIDRSRISDLRALAEKFDLLPKSWRSQLDVPANRRPSDNADQEVTLTVTHWKHLRARVKKSIPSDVQEVMEKCVKERWSSSRFKAALDALDAKDSDAGDATAKDTAPAERNPMVVPDYRKTLAALKMAHRWTGTNDELAESIADLLTKVESLIAAEAEKAKAEKEAKEAKKAKKGKAA